jgi:phage-related protein
METVTSFSASLLQSLDGDTAAAAEKADLAITDMSDNANKMGTSMESIENAYQGFAKQNYTMLDNLKLGYGGTKSEMERLITDAEELDSSFEAARDENGDLAMSYSDIVDAIHIV